MLDSTLEDPTSDGALAARIVAAGAARDPDAEDLLCRQLAPRARAYGLKHLRDSHAANDLVQDVLVMMLQRLREGSIREPEHIASFVLGACRQMIVDRRRGDRRREQLRGVYAADVPSAVIAVDDSPSDHALRHCLERLPERERSVLLMSFYQEWPAQQIAHDLGLSNANVRVIRHRGIEHLRDCLRRAGSEP